jgi:hypothetical protein
MWRSQRGAVLCPIVTEQSSRSGPSSLEGYTVEELQTNQVAHSIRLALLTPEQLRRSLSALAEKNAQPAKPPVFSPSLGVRAGILSPFKNTLLVEDLKRSLEAKLHVGPGEVDGKMPRSEEQGRALAIE